MLTIPYIKPPDENACALACYTMVAKYFFPETTLEQVAKISQWDPGYVVWSFRFWLWIMDKGIKITEYDPLDYEIWAERGEEGLKKSVGEEEFRFYKENTRDLGVYSEDIRKVLRHKNFTHIKTKPTFADLEKAYQNGAVCEVVLDSATLDGDSGFSLHRVVILDVGDVMTFHDPREDKAMPSRKINRELFEKAWLQAIEEPELCVYFGNNFQPEV